MKKLAFGGLALAAGLTLTLAATPATAVTSTSTFKVNTMTTSSSAVVNADPTSGDDGGYLAVTPDVLLRDGDDEIYSYNKTTLVAVGGGFDSSNSNSLFSDLTTEIAYEFITTPDGFTGAYELDGTGNRTATQLTFTETIPAGNGDAWVGGSGAGQVAFWNGTTGDIWVVSLPAGTITKVTGQSLFSAFVNDPASNGEGGLMRQAGILEFDCTAYSFVLVDGDTKSGTRYNTATATTEVVIPAGPNDDGDIDTIMVSPSNSRWYAHAENPAPGPTSVFGIDTTDLSEPIASGAATFTSEAICGAPAPAPVLPDTGMSENAGIWAASAALIAGLGVAGVFMARRRQA
jgi:LPXTG-motif cell wall-anchored protein